MARDVSDLKEWPRARSVAPAPAAPVAGALAHSLHLTALAADEFRARLGEQLGLNAIDVSALIEIYDHPDIRPTDLGRAIHMRSAGLTALADRLIRSGYLHRTRDPNDRRGYRLRLSPAGIKAAGWIFDTVSTALDDSRLGDPDSLAAALTRLASALDAVRIAEPSESAAHGA